MAPARAVPQPAQLHRWRAPIGVRQDGEFLRYDKKKTYAKGGELRPVPDLLDSFRRLAAAPDDEIVAFAAEHGVLGLCEHDAPYTACQTDPATGELVAGYIDNPADRERLSTWRYYAGLAERIVSVATTLHGRGHRVDAADLEPLVHFGGYGMFPTMQIAGSVTGARSAVAAALTRWLHDGDAALRVEWRRGSPQPELVIGGEGPDAGLFTALGLQLALACTRAEGLWRCTACGRLHERSRPPRPGQRAFCDECRVAGVPLKLANRDRRARQRAEGEQ